MLRLIKNIFTYIAVALIFGGLAVLGWQYFRNKQLFEVLLNNSIVKGSFDVLTKMAYAVVAIFVGLIFLLIALKIAGVVRRNEKEKQAAIMEQQREAEELNRQLRKEAEEAKAEAERAKTTAALYQQTLTGKKPEEVKEESEVTE